MTYGRRTPIVRGEPAVPIIDLFAGPGGLGEGFSAPYRDGRPSRFRIALSIEMDPVAHQTLELRAAFRYFDHGDVPDDYYRFARAQMSRAEFWAAPSMREAARAARNEAWNAELGAIPAGEVRTRVRRALAGSRDSVLIGGPPCQAYSLVGRSRNRGNPDYVPEADARHTLYREYLQVLATHWPAVFVMENVKGLLSASHAGEGMFARILEDLHDPMQAISGRPGRGQRTRYAVVALTSDADFQLRSMPTERGDAQRFVVRCEDFGIPQARHRVILLGIREDIPIPPALRLEPHGAPVTAGDVLDGLPALRSGLSGKGDSLEAWRSALRSARDAGWFRTLRRSAPSVATEIEGAVSQALNTSLNRGAPFVTCDAPANKHGEWYADPRLGGVLNHETRSHIPGDIHRYLFASAYAAATGRSPVLGHFPAGLLPAHRNVDRALSGSIFNDRFRVQVRGRPSTTVTSHISKDGHYYIHYNPAQCRSLTVREAARLQSFPDNYFFSGGRTAQYHQIGNAVPPLLARQIAEVVSAILR